LKNVAVVVVIAGGVNDDGAVLMVPLVADDANAEKVRITSSSVWCRCCRRRWDK